MLMRDRAGAYPLPSLCAHRRVRTLCMDCKPDPRRDLLQTMGPMEPHWWPAGAVRTIRRTELAALEAAAPTGRKPRLPGTTPREYWNAHDGLYPGGSSSSREWRWIAEAVRERDGNACVVCGSTEILQIDHLRPLSQGGANEWSNLWTLCRLCHAAKTGRALS